MVIMTSVYVHIDLQYSKRATTTTVEVSIYEEEPVLECMSALIIMSDYEMRGARRVNGLYTDFATGP